MRSLIMNDVYAMSRILKKIDIKVDANDKNNIDGKTIVSEKTQEQVGVDLILKIAENIHLAQNEVNKFIGDLIGISGDEFAKLPLSDGLKYVEEFKNLPGIESFFKSASRLMK